MKFSLHALVFSFLVTLLIGSRTLAQAPARDPEFNALVFHKSTVFRHDSLPAGVAAIKKLSAEHNFNAEFTEDAAAFTTNHLTRFQVVVFLNNCGDLFNEDQRAAFQGYIRNGGGFAGIHCPIDCEKSWTWFSQLLGTRFLTHPAVMPGTIEVEDHANPSTAHLPNRWTRTDEWYSFNSNPRGKVHVLATLDETTYTGGAMGHDHPIAWCHKFEGGRVWYTALGHTEESYRDPLMLQHVLGGIQIAAGVKAADFSPNHDPHFKKVALAATLHNPMEIAVAKDGRVFCVEIAGRVKLCQPDSQTAKVIGTLNVCTNLDDGLLGIALDPDFLNNHWLYLCYSAPEVSENRVSRFTLEGDALDLASERILVRIATQRLAPPCHTGGSLTFDAKGNLYISTGDNVNPFASDGYSPSDERPGRAPWDAQGTSASPNDLRGKILRVHPEKDGPITIPPGNLFSADGSNGRPEIYVMGCRNPFRISVDPRTGFLYWGEVGPDANAPNPNRGPAGFDEVNQARAAGNFGWPHFVADNKPYRKYDFATKTFGPAWDPAKPINTSPNHTGAHELPPAQPAMIYYPYGPSTKFPEVGSGGRTAMAGPVYYFDPHLKSDRKLPAIFDHTLFIYEWSRDWIITVKLDAQDHLVSLKRFLPAMSFKRPMDLELGPDGALYLLEWGTNYMGDSQDAQIVRIDYVGSNAAARPTATEPSTRSSSAF